MKILKFILHAILNAFHLVLELSGAMEERNDPRATRKLRQPPPSGAPCYPHYQRLDDAQLVPLEDLT